MLNATCYSGLNPGTEKLKKDNSGKTGEMWIKSVV